MFSWEGGFVTLSSAGRGFWFPARSYVSGKDIAMTATTKPAAKRAPAKPASKPQPKAAAPAPKLCGCGCKQTVTKRYRPGHDARHCSQLRAAYEAGKIGRDAALAQVAHSPLLVSKLTRSLALADQRNAAKTSAAKKPAAKKAAPAKPAAKPSDPQKAAEAKIRAQDTARKRQVSKPQPPTPAAAKQAEAAAAKAASQ